MEKNDWDLETNRKSYKMDVYTSKSVTAFGKSSTLLPRNIEMFIRSFCPMIRKNIFSFLLL